MKNVPLLFKLIVLLDINLTWAGIKKFVFTMKVLLLKYILSMLALEQVFSNFLLDAPYYNQI